MRVNEELRQGLMNLVYRVGCGLATGQPPAGLVDVLDELMPELRRLRGEVVLEQLEQEMRAKPRKPRKTQGWIRRNGMARRAAEAVPGSDR